MHGHQLILPNTSVAQLEPTSPHVAELFASVTGGADPFSLVLLGVAVILACGVVGRALAIRFKQSPVLGELLMGMLVGNIGYHLGLKIFVVIVECSSPLSVLNYFIERSVSGVTAADAVSLGITPRALSILQAPNGMLLLIISLAFWLFSNLGVILLLFLVGLESSVTEILRVGGRALAVAVVGMLVPFLFGLGLGSWLLPDESVVMHVFLAATLCATSVGITARVLQDLRRGDSQESRIILGAAVIDDILGLIVLAIVAGVAQTGSVDWGQAGRIALLSFVFLGFLMWFGERLLKKCISSLPTVEFGDSKLVIALVVALGLSWVAGAIGLAAIVGAFAAGVILHDSFFEKFGDTHQLDKLVHPIEKVFSPVFFFLMGMHVNLGEFLNGDALEIGLLLTVGAIAGKIIAGIVSGKGVDKLTVGIGMVPRGEVGLIFASIGASLGIFKGPIFSSVVMMVMLTTLFTPLALRWSLSRNVGSAKNL